MKRIVYFVGDNVLVKLAYYLLQDVKIMLVY